MTEYFLPTALFLIIGVALFLTACGGGGGGGAVVQTPAAAPMNAPTVVAPTGSIVFEGDSLIATTVSTWPNTVKDQSTRNTRWHARGISGTPTWHMVARYAMNVGPYRPTDGPGVFFINGGTNDIVHQLATPAVAYDNLKYLWATARADGFKVVAFTLHSVTHRTVPCPTCLADMAELNRLMLSDPSLYDRIIRMDQLFPDVHDTTLLYDKLHFTPAGNQKVAEAALAVLATLP